MELGGWVEAVKANWIPLSLFVISASVFVYSMFRDEQAAKQREAKEKAGKAA